MADDMQVDPEMEEMAGLPEDAGLEDTEPDSFNAEMEMAEMQAMADADAAQADTETEPDMAMAEAQGPQFAAVGWSDPAAFETHPYADLLPAMTKHEYERLVGSIAVVGLQEPVTLFQGKLLDGRNRVRACIEAGRPVFARELLGTENDAMTYVVSANQYRRELSKSQEATSAVNLLPHVTEKVKADRLARVRAAWERKRSGGCLPILANNLLDPEKPVSTRAIAADMMGVSNGYVGDALVLHREAPELFEKVHTGMLTLQEALRELKGENDDPRRQQSRVARMRLNRAIKNLDEHPDFFDRFDAFMDEFDPPSE